MEVIVIVILADLLVCRVMEHANLHVIQQIAYMMDIVTQSAICPNAIMTEEIAIVPADAFLI